MYTRITYNFFAICNNEHGGGLLGFYRGIRPAMFTESAASVMKFPV